MMLNDMILTLVTYSLTDPNVLFLELLSQPENGGQNGKRINIRHSKNGRCE